MNGGVYDRATLKQVAGYVVQDDLLFANLTVYETLLVRSLLFIFSIYIYIFFALFIFYLSLFI